jgi:hypothetical protein
MPSIACTAAENRRLRWLADPLPVGMMIIIGRTCDLCYNVLSIAARDRLELLSGLLALAAASCTVRAWHM